MSSLKVREDEIQVLVTRLYEVHPDAIRKKLEAIKNSKSGNPILDWAGSWQGDDIDELLKEVYALRSQVKF